MNKDELVDAVAQSTGVPRASAEAAVAAVLDSITNALKNGDKVAITGFGTFEVRSRAARTARNPTTGATSVMPAVKYASFSAEGFEDRISQQRLHHIRALLARMGMDDPTDEFLSSIGELVNDHGDQDALPEETREWFRRVVVALKRSA